MSEEGARRYRQCYFEDNRGRYFVASAVLADDDVDERYRLKCPPEVFEVGSALVLVEMGGREEAMTVMETGPGKYPGDKEPGRDEPVYLPKKVPVYGEFLLTGFTEDGRAILGPADRKDFFWVINA